MLKIRSEQINTFQPNAEVAFIIRVMNYLRENHADVIVQLPETKHSVAEMPAPVLRNLVENGVSRARAYGISWKSSLISFVVLMFAVSPNFDAEKYVSGMLNEESIPADERIEKIMEQMTDEDWEKVAANYDAAAWRLSLEGEKYERSL